MESWHYLLLSGLGFVAGFLNVMAGGGSLITMPVMIFIGMTPAAANGTNRIALLLQNITAVTRFRQKGFFDLKLSFSLALCTLPGAIAGAIAAVKIDPLWFKRLLAVVMIAVMLTTIHKPKKQDPQSADKLDKTGLILAHLGMLLVGFYGGFIQAGVGFILMAMLRGVLKFDLVRVNMHKVFIIGVYMLPTLLVFALMEQVFWIAGLALALGTTMGAWIATQLQIKRGEGPIRIVFAICVLAMAVKLVVT